MASPSIIAQTVDYVRDNVLPLIKFNASTDQDDFNDINKRASKNTLNIYAIASNNVSPAQFSRIAKGIETKVATLLDVIIQDYIGQNAASAKDFLRRNLTNPDVENSIVAKADSANVALGSMHENFDFSNLKFSQSLTEAPAGRRNNSPVVANGDQPAAKNTDLGSSQASTFMSPGSLHSYNLTVATADGQAVQFKLNIFVRVTVIIVDSEELIATLAQSKNAQNFYQYLKWRAGKASFFKDVLLNLSTVMKEADRRTSLALKDRVLSKITSRSGVIWPKAFDEITEFKNFLIILDSSDADRLSSEYKLTLTNAGSLHRIFSSLNILSICIIDEPAKKFIIFDSDRPSDMQVTSTAALDNEKQLQAIFSSIQRG
jgi:hypothetical protein